MEGVSVKDLSAITEKCFFRGYEKPLSCETTEMAGWPQGSWSASILAAAAAAARRAIRRIAVVSWLAC